MREENNQHHGEPVAHMARIKLGSLAGQLIQVDHSTNLNPKMYEGPFPVFRHAELVDNLKSQLAGRDALLRELAEAAEMFSCSAHCETSDAGDALELLNKILARVNSHKSPKCKVCGYMLHPDGYCSFRDCGVPGKGTKALSASAEPRTENKGVKAHDGQKLLVQHILDNDKGLSDSSRVILEKLIEG